VPALQQLGVDIQYATSHTAIAELLKADRADLAPVNVFNIEAFAASAGMETAQLARAILLTRSGGYYLVLHQGSDPALVARLQSAFAAMVRDKTLARIVSSWSPRASPGTEPARK
jgi:ABC-type amino acid transport substrate-binding protein